MRYLLSQFPSIPRKALKALAQGGIKDTDQFLAKTSLPLERSALAEALLLKVDDVTRWAGLADLVRIKGVSPRMAEMLMGSGVAQSVQTFIEAMRQPDQVAERLSSWAGKKTTAIKSPSPSRLAGLLDEALELHPRLTLVDIAVDGSFRAELLQREKTERAHSRRISFAFSGIVLVAVVVLYGLSQYYLNLHLQEKVIPGDELNRMSIEATKIMIGLNNTSLLLVFAILLAFMAVLFVLYDWLSHLQDAPLALWLFDRPGHRKFYRELKTIELRKQLRGLWLAVGIFAVLAVVLVFYSYILLQDDMEMTDFARAISLPVVIGGVLLGIAASLPVLRFYQKGVRLRDNLESLHRYMIFYLTKVMTLPLMVVLLTQFAMPLAFDLHRNLYREWIVPPVRVELLEMRTQIEIMELESEEDELRRDEILDTLDEEILPGLHKFGVVSSEADTSFEDAYIPAALNMVVWTALTAYLLLFVLPYLILGGWRRGMFYMLLLAVSLNTENILTAYSPTWFMLPADSAGSFLLVAIFILANALLFDWLFSEITREKTVCLCCGSHIETNSRFCNVCGFAQK